MLCFSPLNDGIILSFQERERRRQHVMLMKAVEARKKAEVCKTKELNKRTLSFTTPLSSLLLKAFSHVTSTCSATFPECVSPNNLM